MAAARAALALLLCACVYAPVLAAPSPAPPAPPPAPPPRYSARIVHTKYGAVRGVIVEPASRRLEPVEAFRGVAYARAPRLAAPAPPAPAPRAALADTFAPVCPQQVPDLHNRSAALERMPLGVYNQLRQIVPLLANQSEDCLYLNIYVPGSGAAGAEAPYAVVVWLGGGGGGSADGEDTLAPAALEPAAVALASRARLIVVTLSYRIGLLGYLPVSGSAGAPLAALDVLAALRWVAACGAAFGGAPARLALAGHGAGAELANALLALPAAAGLVSRIILISGTALSPSAYTPDPAALRRHVAQSLNCEAETNAIDGEDWLVACVRARPLQSLLGVAGVRARFLRAWAGAAPRGGAARALHAAPAFLHAPLLLVLASAETYHFFNEDEIRNGFEEEHRNRILRTYIRNVYHWHRNEIYAAARNEYTDWEKPIQHPINIRDATLEAVSDAAAAAPALRLAALRASRGADTRLAHFAHHAPNARPDVPQRLGSTPQDSVEYFMGLPLVSAGAAAGGGRNYSRSDVAVSEACVALLAAFVKTGDPTPARAHPAPALAWPRYEVNTQHYLSIGTKLRVKSHYRGHKMALWLHLVPQLHRPGAAPAHHHFRDRDLPDMFAGDVYPEDMTLEKDDVEEGAVTGAADSRGGVECAPPSAAPAATSAPPAAPDQPDTLANIDSHYYSYSVALGVTVGAGCLLLALNALVFAGIYLQRGRKARAAAAAASSRRALRDTHGSTSSQHSSGSITSDSTPSVTPQKSSLKRSTETELKERPCSAPPKKRVQIQEISV